MPFPTPVSIIAGICLSACAVAVAISPAAALECLEGQRAFTHAGGETCIPEHPERIVAARGDKIATPLLDIGAPVVGAGFRTDSGVTYLRGAADIFGQEYVEAAGIVSIGDPNQFDFETVAGLEPDLIILPDWQIDLLDKATTIAPTIVVPDNLPFLDHLALLADAVGMSGVYEERIAGYRAKIEKIRQTIGDPSRIVVSRFDISQNGLWFYPNWGAVDQVINDIGFSRPAIEAEATENITDVSVELIGAFDGDLLISSYAPRFGQTIESLTALRDDTAPFWRELDAVKSGNLYWFERDVWVGYTFKSLETAADGLLLLSAGRFPQHD